MGALHPALLPSLDLLPPTTPVTLLTRHSLRELGSNGVANYELPLTAEGVALAEWWGGQLRRELAGLHASPVQRCVDTARAMALGAGRADMAEQQAGILMEPGCFVSNMHRVGPLFLELGPVQFANMHFRQTLEGLLDPQAGTARLLRHLLAHQGGEGSLTIQVTHDTILAAFIYHLMGHTSIDDTDWPWMMEGAWVWFEGDKVHWLWRGLAGQRELQPYLAEALGAG